MSPDNARIFHAEDNKHWREIVNDFAQMKNHTVVYQATTREEAEVYIDSGKIIDDQIQVAILDGNLSEESLFGKDAIDLSAKIKQKAPAVKIIGLSGSSLSSDNIDLYVGKTNIKNLPEEISKI